MKTNQMVAAISFTFLLCLALASPARATGYTLTLSAQGYGTVTPDNTSPTHPSGAVITITAAASNGWYFANWSGDASGTVNPLQVTMNSDLVITGNFLAYPTYSLTLVTNGQGSIDLNPPGGSYLSNTVVTASATAAAGWVFTAWSGATNTTANPVSLPVDTNLSLTAAFAQLPAFDVEPASVTNKAGSTVNFSTHAVGATPLGYEWYFSGGTLSPATNSTLSLTNVGTGQAGNYWVVATNFYGSATSYVASLTLTNSVGPTNVVSSPNEASLRAAIALGGWVGIQFNGTVSIANTINITNNVILDGSGVAAAISGGEAVRLFYVAPGASLTVSNLTLANGNCLVTSGGLGTPADAGAIYNNGGLVTVVGCTLTNNAAQSLVYGGLARGGAIFNNGGSVSLYQSVIISNSVVGGGPNNPEGPLQSIGTGLGGAIYNTNGTVSFKGCNVIGNSSTGVPEYDLAYGTGLTMGGATFQASGSMTIANSSFEMNAATGGPAPQYATFYRGSPAYGGAVAVTGGNLSLDSDLFGTNQAVGGAGNYHDEAAPAYGGAVYCTTGWTATDSTFYGNGALAGSGNYDGKGVGAFGGAIYNIGRLNLNRCSICANSVCGGSGDGEGGAYNGGDGLGAGIFNAAQLAVTNSTLALNSAIGGDGGGFFGSVATSGSAIGGGIFNNTNATFAAMNVTVASNACISPALYGSTNGLVIGFQIGNTNGTLSLHNSIIAYSGTNSNAYGPITDLGYNICSDGSASLESGFSYNNTDPQLAPLGNYGGPTLCMALLPNSPAIDFGDTAGCPNTDQRGYIRPFGSGPDMGAYEYGSVPLVTPYMTLSPSGTNLLLSFTALPPSTYYLQGSTNLTSWFNLSTNGPIAISTNISQTISKLCVGRCYFRVLMQ